MRVQRPRRAAPSDALRPTRAEINLAALRHNLRVVKRCAEDAGGARVWPVLKADGYGHGAPAVARTLERAGAEGFCVALVEEAIELRDAGIRAPVLVMGGYHGDAYAEILGKNLLPVVYDVGQIEGLARAARATGQRVLAHLKVDTGMARLGATMADLEALARALASHPEVRITGLMTHLACADAPDDGALAGFTAEQVERFEQATRRLLDLGAISRGVVRHAANSAALLRGDAVYDAVRPGIAIFGVSPIAPSIASTGTTRGRSAGDASPDSPREPRSGGDLRSVMRVRSEIVDLRTIASGQSVGYGGLFRATRPTRIATVPMGYADGLSRHCSNRAHVLVRGRRARIVGAVSMDMSMIDVTDIPSAALRDEVVVLGAQDGTHGKDMITADELALHAGTIPWEVLTSISRRVPRFYREP